MQSASDPVSYKVEESIFGESKAGGGARKVPFEIKIFFAVAVLLSWPVAICFLLYGKPSISYWFGVWEMALAIGIIVWTLAMYFLFILKFIGKTTATVCLLVLPCTALAISCEVQELQFQFISTALLSQDCRSNAAKVQLQQSWEAAHKVSTECDNKLMKETGSPLEQIREVRRFQDCPNYREVEADNKREWAYFQELEKSYDCGGWCSPSLPLWRTSKTPLDSCSISAGFAMTNSISHMGTQVSVYALIVLTSVSLWLLLAPKWMKDDEDL